MNENGIISRLLNSDNLKIAEYLDSGFSYVTAILEYALLSVRYWWTSPVAVWSTCNMRASPSSQTEVQNIWIK